MECSLGQVLQVVLAILTRVRPKDLGGPAPDASWASARSTITSPVRLAAFLGRVV